MNVLEARRRLLGAGVYKKTVTGNPAIAQGSLARMYPGIEMEGWTEQLTTTGAQLSYIEKGSYESNGLGKIDYESRARIFSPFLLTKTVTFSVSNGYKIYVRKFLNGSLATDGYWTNKVSIIYDGTEYTLTAVIKRDDEENITDKDISDAKFMLNEGSTALPWEPYTGGAPSPSPEYPQEIVSAGKYNEDTQKWEYEITIANEQTDPDKNQSVTITADRPLTKWDKLEKRNGQWGWVYKSAEINITDESPLQKYGDDKISLYVSDAYLFGIPYCDKYICQNGVPSIENRMGLSSGSHAFVVYDTAYMGDVESYKQWLSENPLTVWYETAEETFVPLSKSEQEQMNALHTFRPTTVLSNDEGCEMSLTYKTKKSLEVTT